MITWILLLDDIFHNGNFHNVINIVTYICLMWCREMLQILSHILQLTLDRAEEYACRSVSFSRVSLHTREYLHFSLSALELRLPFPPHCLEWHKLCCRKILQGREHGPALVPSLWQLYTYFSSQIVWPLMFLPSKLLSQLAAVLCWSEAGKRIRIPFTL